MNTTLIVFTSLFIALTLAPSAFPQSIAEDLEFRSETAIDEKTGDTVQTFYYPNGEKRSEGRLSRGVRHGQWQIWYSNGRLWKLGDYHLGQIDGKWTIWNDGLDLEAYKLAAQLENGARTGVWTQYYPSGNVFKSETWKDGKRDGEVKVYYHSGQLKRLERWIEGRAHGAWSYWHENGQIMRQESYNAGKPDGKWQYYYDNGKLERIENWKDGMKYGRWTFWYESGVKELEGSFVNDQAVGVWTKWYHNGEKECEGNLQAYQQEDEWTYWYPNSRKKATVIFDRGDIIGVKLEKYRDRTSDRSPRYLLKEGISTKRSRDRNATGGVVEGRPSEQTESRTASPASESKPSAQEAVKEIDPGPTNPPNNTPR